MTINLPVFECDHCGACCRKLMIEADHLDVLREPRIAKECTLLDGHGKTPLADAAWNMVRRGSQSLACAFIGDDNKCGIYPTRPNVCVSAQAGGASCQRAREWSGLPPLVARTSANPTMLDRIADLARDTDDDA